jgi:hypothetical protein
MNNQANRIKFSTCQIENLMQFRRHRESKG